jgi:hypothetical protein
MESNSLVEKDFIQSLIDVMRNPNFRNFYNQNCSEPCTWNDIEVIILYMKLLEFIETKYKEKHGKLPNEETLYKLIKNIMSTKNSRKLTLNVFDNYKKGIIPKTLSLTNFTNN